MKSLETVKNNMNKTYDELNEIVGDRATKLMEALEVALPLMDNEEIDKVNEIIESLKFLVIMTE